LRPKKRFGQHFLLDPRIANRIASLAIDTPAQRILEIGAGTGVLTAALRAHGAVVTAIEIDPRLVEILRERDDLEGVELLQADAMRFDYDAYAAGRPWRVAGNLPYNVGTPLLAELATRDEPPERIVAMLQKDVVDRLVARPATASYGSLTLLVGARMEVRRAFTLGRTHFYPPPKVDSSVVVLERRTGPAPIESFPGFYEVVRGAFAYRRKTLANSLSRALAIPRERTVAALKSLELDPEARAEQLDLGAFTELAGKLAD
jgi:16S rRNA (adenine1518-N6/adenine1519-N6)-dimethyltransferase